MIYSHIFLGGNVEYTVELIETQDCVYIKRIDGDPNVRASTAFTDFIDSARNSYDLSSVAIPNEQYLDEVIRPKIENLETMLEALRFVERNIDKPAKIWGE